MSVPEEVALARAIAALRTAMLLPLAAALGLGVVAAAILALAGDPNRVWPGLSTLLIGQFAALVAGATAFVALQHALRPGADHATVRARAAVRLRRVVRPLLVVLGAATAAWALVEPTAGLGALVGALVGAQAVLPVTMAARTLEAPVSP